MNGFIAARLVTTLTVAASLTGELPNHSCFVIR